jgi:hypothetical protein
MLMGCFAIAHFISLQTCGALSKANIFVIGETTTWQPSQVTKVITDQLCTGTSPISGVSGTAIYLNTDGAVGLGATDELVAVQYQSRSLSFPALATRRGKSQTAKG